MGRRPRDWKPPQMDERHAVEPDSVLPVPSVFNAPTGLAQNGVFGGVVSPVPEVINTVKADEPIEPIDGDVSPEAIEQLRCEAEELGVAFDENEPGRWIPPSGRDWVGSPSVSIRAGLAAALANPGPWPNAERLSRAQRHMEELINALPEAIEAADGLLKEDIETLRDILA